MYTPKISTKFQRRSDLTAEIRIRIAYIILYSYTWGASTRLSRKYKVSRQFIYELGEDFSKFNQIYFGNAQNTDLKKDKTCYWSDILSLRMEGRCSIQSISMLSTRFGLPNCSVGYISQTLTEIGNKIGNKLNISSIDGFTFQICSDEIFAKQNPILITVDPISHLILSIVLSETRKGADWAKHWKSIIDQQVHFTKIIRDAGTGMSAGLKIVAEMSDIEQQIDSFHSVSHVIGLWVSRLLSTAYSAIEYEYGREILFYNSKTEYSENKHLLEHKKAQEKSIKAIELYDNFTFLYHCLLECLQIFDKKGNLKDIQKVSADFDLALELIKTLEHKTINKDIKSIENCKKDLFCFYKSAEIIINELSQKVDNQILRKLCLAWQFHKNGIKSKDSERKKMFENREEKKLQEVKELTSKEYITIKNSVYVNLNQIIQSSASVENINSLLRPYLNSCKNQVSQEFLNLFMFYHNHHRFAGGERKGKTPMEIATGTTQQKNWQDLLMEKISIN